MNNNSRPDRRCKQKCEWIHQHFKIANCFDFRDSVSFLLLYRGQLVALISNKWPHYHIQKWPACTSRPVQNQADLYPFGTNWEWDFPDSRSSWLFANIQLYSSFSGRPISCSCQLEETERDTDALCQLLAGNFSTPQKSKVFCEVFLSHSNPKRAEVLKYLVT